jgi:hypothetical protein
VRTPEQAVAESYRWTQNKPGMCLWTVQEWFGSPHLHPDAWTHAKHVTLISGTPPPGVPVWYGPGTGSRFGHVALSLGGGRIRSTDCPREGVVGDEDLHWPTRRWGHDYIGWSASIGGQPIPGLMDGPQPEPDEGEEEDMAKPWACNLGGAGAGWVLSDLATWRCGVGSMGVIDEGVAFGAYEKLAGGQPLGPGWVEHIMRLPEVPGPRG